MKISVVLFALMALVYHGEAAAVPSRELKAKDDQDKRSEDEEEYDENADPLLTEVDDDEGTVRFFEVHDGVLLVTIHKPAESDFDPFDDYQKEKKGKNNDVGEFYEHLTGEKPKGKLKNALKRHKKNEENSAEREDWELPEIEEAFEPEFDTDEGDRDLIVENAPYGSDGWWSYTACTSVQRTSNCICYTRRTGNTYLIREAADFIQKAFSYRGSINHKVWYWRCYFAGILGFKCYWHFLESKWLDAYDTPDRMWYTAGGNVWFKGALENGDGDGWHLSWYWYPYCDPNWLIDCGRPGTSSGDGFFCPTII